MAKPRSADDIVEHNRRMWDRLASAGIPYTRPQGTPPRTRVAKRRFFDRLSRDRLVDLDFDGLRALSLAGGGGWDAVLLAELGAQTTLLDVSARQCATVRRLARERGTRVKVVQGDMRELSRHFMPGSFDLVYQQHSLVFVPDAARVIREVARVLAPGGTYVTSTMHPVTLRMQETWTGTGWQLKKSYFADGPIPYRDAVWEFGKVRVAAPTLEYGHRTSDLVNAMARAGMVIDGLWEWSPGDESGPPGSQDDLEQQLPAFVEIRARKLSPRSGLRPPAAADSRRRTASRSR